ncbi:MAG: hypothetical protein WCF78_03040 [archaeon]
MVKYNKLVVLVHPLWYFVKEYNELKRNTPDAYNKTKSILTKTLGVYGNILNKYKQREDVCFLLIKPDFTIPENIKVLETHITPFVQHGKKVLGNRFIISNYVGEVDAKSRPLFKDKEVYNNFRKKIDIEYFGECREWCVKETMECIPDEFKVRGIEVKSNKLLQEGTFYKFREDIGLNLRIKTAHERRMNQQAKKISKLKNPKLKQVLQRKYMLK